MSHDVMYDLGNFFVNCRRDYSVFQMINYFSLNPLLEQARRLWSCPSTKEVACCVSNLHCIIERLSLERGSFFKSLKEEMGTHNGDL